MHESVFAQKLVDGVVKDTRRNTAEIKSAVIEVGELAEVTARDLEAALKQFVGWALEVREVPAAVACSCKFKGAPKITERGHHFSVWECPKCGRKMPRLIQGGDVTVVEIEV